MNLAATKLEQEFEAPEPVLALVRDAAKQLGANEELAEEAARTGVFQLLSRNVSVVLAPDDEHLVLSTPLDEEWATQPARRLHALRASPSLLLQTGVAFCITLAGPALMCRWSLDDMEAGLLSAWIREFALMADLIGAGTAAVAN
jgi:hypothetical protein